jgi:cytochrome c-type biogenesis protein CcmE
MKKSHIVIIIFVVVAIGVVISLFMNISTYSNFTKAGRNQGKDFQIIGKLDKSKPIIYDARFNPNEFSFYMIDDKGQVKKVIYSGAKPQDFEKPAQLVVIGSMSGDSVFKAKSLLMQCPSKYNDKKKPESFGKKEFDSNKPQQNSTRL